MSETGMDGAAGSASGEGQFPDPMPECYADKFIKRAYGTTRSLRESGVVEGVWGKWKGHYIRLHTKADLLKIQLCLENGDLLNSQGVADLDNKGEFWVIRRTSPLRKPRKFLDATGKRIPRSRRRGMKPKRPTYEFANLGAGEFLGRGRLFTFTGALKNFKKIPRKRLRNAILRKEKLKANPATSESDERITIDSLSSSFADFARRI